MTRKAKKSNSITIGQFMDQLAETVPLELKDEQIKILPIVIVIGKTEIAIKNIRLSEGKTKFVITLDP